MEPKVDHFAVAANTKKQADKFFNGLLGLKKTREFEVNAEKMEKFFGVKKTTQLVRYENDKVAAEIFITEDKSKANDLFTHQCIIVNDKDKFLWKAETLGYEITKVPREEKNSYYLFIKDSFGNIYEIKD